MKYSFLLSMATAMAVCTQASAAKLGDPAAPLTIKEWIKGKPVDVKDGKNIYVVEFWATWCGPCKTSIPHLTEVQKKLKDKGVVIVGISDETVDKVKPWVADMGDKMDYTVAVDNERKTSDGYMKAYGQGGIPTSFIVGKDGKVLWFGHPMGDMEKTLDEILAGKYDLQAAIKKDERRAALDDYHKASVEGEANAKEMGKKLLAETEGVEALCDFAFSVAANARNKNRDFGLAEEALNKAEKAAGKKVPQILGIRAIARFESGKQEEGLAMAKEAVELCKDEKEKPRYENYVKVMESRMKSADKTKSK